MAIEVVLHVTILSNRTQSLFLVLHSLQTCPGWIVWLLELHLCLDEHEWQLLFISHGTFYQIWYQAMHRQTVCQHNFWIRLVNITSVGARDRCIGDCSFLAAAGMGLGCKILPYAERGILVTLSWRLGPEIPSKQIVYQPTHFYLFTVLFTSNGIKTWEKGIYHGSPQLLA